MTMVRADDFMHLRHMIRKRMDEGRAPVGIRENTGNRRAIFMSHHDRVQDAPTDRNEMWSEDKSLHRGARKIRDHFGRMPMFQDAVRANILTDFAKMSLGFRFATSSGNTGLAVHNDSRI